MKSITAERVAEYGYNLGNQITREFGGMYVPQSDSLQTLQARLTRPEFVKKLRRGRLPWMSVETSLIKPQEPHNLAVLTGPEATTRAFGLMRKTSLRTHKIVHAGIIASNTRPGELHILPLLEDGGVPLEKYGGIDDLGRIMIETGGLIQRPSVGSAEADKSPGGEIGHVLQGVSAVTDIATLEAVKAGNHVAHDWGVGLPDAYGRVTAGQGAAVALTQRDSGISAFAVNTETGKIQNGFAPEIVITDTVDDWLLVDHQSITDKQESSRLGVSPLELVAGMGMTAAESQLAQPDLRETALQSQVMNIMRSL